MADGGREAAPEIKALERKGLICGQHRCRPEMKDHPELRRGSTPRPVFHDRGHRKSNSVVFQNGNQSFSTKRHTKKRHCFFSVFKKKSCLNFCPKILQLIQNLKDFPPEAGKRPERSGSKEGEFNRFSRLKHIPGPQRLTLSSSPGLKLLKREREGQKRRCFFLIQQIFINACSNFCSTWNKIYSRLTSE